MSLTVKIGAVTCIDCMLVPPAWELDDVYWIENNNNKTTTTTSNIQTKTKQNKTKENKNNNNNNSKQKQNKTKKKSNVSVILYLFIPKVRCLEFVLGDAIKQGCTSVVTCGPALSNSMRALAVMAASLGLTAHLLVKNDKVVFNPRLPCLVKQHESTGGNGRFLGTHSTSPCEEW